MIKYKCEDCDHVFEGDLSTMQCPSCGSINIKKANSGKVNKKWLIICAIILGILELIVFWPSDDSIEAEMSIERGTVIIVVDGPSASALSKEYKVVIYDDQNSQHGQPLGFDRKKKVATYQVMQLMEGRCYSFSVERKDGKPIKNLVWKNSNEYCVPTSPVKPEIAYIDQGIADHQSLVWNKIRVVMKETGNFTYTLGDITQQNPEFNNIKPGIYTVVVVNEDGVSVSQSLFLKDIDKLASPLTIQQVQSIFDKVSSGSMSASDAQGMLADGNVNLTSTIEPGIKTLWGALMEAAMGVKFRVDNFENDLNTNKIKSGSLNISRR